MNSGLFCNLCNLIATLPSHTYITFAMRHKLGLPRLSVFSALSSHADFFSDCLLLTALVRTHLLVVYSILLWSLHVSNLTAQCSPPWSRLKLMLTESPLSDESICHNMLERREGLATWTKHHLQEVQGIHTHISARSSDQSHLSHLDSHYCSRSQIITALSSVYFVWKLCFYVGTIQRICLFSDDFYSDSTLILTTIAMKQCMDIGARPHVFNF
jgi:hypothetical protein